MLNDHQQHGVENLLYLSFQVDENNSKKKYWMVIMNLYNEGIGIKFIY